MKAVSWSFRGEVCLSDRGQQGQVFGGCTYHGFQFAFSGLLIYKMEELLAHMSPQPGTLLSPTADDGTIGQSCVYQVFCYSI